MQPDTRITAQFGHKIASIFPVPWRLLSNLPMESQYEIVWFLKNGSLLGDQVTEDTL